MAGGHFHRTVLTATFQRVLIDDDQYSVDNQGFEPAALGEPSFTKPARFQQPLPGIQRRVSRPQLSAAMLPCRLFGMMFQAEINFAEESGVVQVETFGVSLNAEGTCFYGMQVSWTRVVSRDAPPRSAPDSHARNVQY